MDAQDHDSKTLRSFSAISRYDFLLKLIVLEMASLGGLRDLPKTVKQRYPALPGIGVNGGIESGYVGVSLLYSLSA